MNELCQESTIKPRTTTIYNREYMREYRKKNKEACSQQAVQDRAKYMHSDKFLDGENKFVDCRRCGTFRRRKSLYIHQNSNQCIRDSEEYDWLSSDDGGGGNRLLAYLTPLNDPERDDWGKEYKGRDMNLSSWISPCETFIIKRKIKRLPKLDLATCFIEVEDDDV